MLNRSTLKRAFGSSSSSSSNNNNNNNKTKKKKTRQKAKKDSNNVITSRKLKILCLHGYEQNIDSFRKKTGSLRRAGKSHVSEFVFLDAPHNALVRDGADEAAGNYAWYLPQTINNDDTMPKFFEDDSQSNDDSSKSSRSWSLPLDESTWHASLEHIGKCFKEQGPFDGVFGFSQGAATAAALCQLQMAKNLKQPLNFIDFKFAIFISGFIPSHGLYIGNEDIDTSMPLSKFNSLHISGKTDEIIKPIRSKALVNKFSNNNNQHVEHSGGHLVPSEKHVRDALKEFLKIQRDNLG